MNDNTDWRTWSISAKNLSLFLRTALLQGVPNGSARTLQQALKRDSQYPARDIAGLCEPIPPDIFVTYHSAQSFADIEYLIWNTCRFASSLTSTEGSDLHRKQVMEHGIRFWIDFLFIDQNSRDITRELDVLPSLLETSDVHIVLGDRPMTRAWCCYEIALFNRHCAGASSERGEMRSFIAPTDKPYVGWEYVAATDDRDKAAIGERIAQDYPGGETGFRRVMDQASGSAVVSKAFGTATYPPAALERMRTAADRWFAREID
jgi:hypothetical protein